MGDLVEWEGRVPRIDVLRGVAILLVMLNHFNIAYPLGDAAWAGIGVGEVLRLLARNGNYGVTIFFAISGTLITGNARRRWGVLSEIRAAPFYARRMARILPCLLLLVGLVTALGCAGVPIFANRGPQGIAPGFLLADVAALTFWINVLMARVGWFNYALCVLWSLSVEEVFYASFPLLCRGLRGGTALTGFWIALVAIGPVWRAVFSGDEYRALYGYWSCFDAIALGCLTAMHRERLRGFGLSHPAAQAAAIAVIVTIYGCAGIDQTLIFGVTLIAASTCVLVVGGGERGGVCLAPVRWSGRRSYELYLFHLVVLGFLRSIVPADRLGAGTRLAWLLVLFAASFGVAAIIFRAFATPVNGAIRRRLGVA